MLYYAYKYQIMMKTITPLLFVMILFWGCDPDRSVFGFSQMGFKPIYAASADLNQLIKSNSPQTLTETGKIYVKGKYLLVNRPYSGIHVFDNTDPAKPINLAFIEIPGNLDVTMKGDYLYADYIGKIAVIDLKDILNPRITQTVSLDTRYQTEPPKATQRQGFSTTYFECPDPQKGTVIGWVYTTLKDAKCWRNEQ
jgi:hypothetical protein